MENLLLHGKSACSEQYNLDLFLTLKKRWYLSYVEYHSLVTEIEKGSLFTM